MTPVILHRTRSTGTGTVCATSYTVDPKPEALDPTSLALQSIPHPSTLKPNFKALNATSCTAASTTSSPLSPLQLFCQFLLYNRRHRSHQHPPIASSASPDHVLVSYSQQGVYAHAVCHSMLTYVPMCVGVCSCVCFGFWCVRVRVRGYVCVCLDARLCISLCHDTTLRRPTRRPSLPTPNATQRTFV